MTDNAHKVDRMSDGRARKFSTVGSYPLVYRVEESTYSTQICCPDCSAEAEDADPGVHIVGGINYENPALHCARCDCRIESAYAEDEARIDA